MGGKASAPAAPDYTPIAAADEQISTQQTQLADSQLQFAQQQYNAVEPSTVAYLNQETANSQQQSAQAAQEENTYNTTFAPIATNFANEANAYNTPGNAAQQAGAAETDVANSFDAQRASSLSSLESYGIDPSQTRYQALDLGTRISQAAAGAATGTQSYLNTQATGLALQGEAVNMGQGIQSNVGTEYAAAQGAGSSGINSFNSVTGATNQSTATGGNIIGQGVQSNSAAASALNMGYQNNLAGAQFEAQQNQALSSGLGSLVGAGLMAAAIAF